MKDRDKWGRPDAARKAPRTPEEEKVRRLKIATEVLTGVSVFDQMKEDKQASVIDNTVEVVAVILARYGGRFRSTNPDLIWSALSWGYSAKTADSYAFGKFRKALDYSARAVCRTLCAMLEAGVDTRELLDALGKPPPDPLEGMTSLRKVRGMKLGNPWGT